MANRSVLLLISSGLVNFVAAGTAEQVESYKKTLQTVSSSRYVTEELTDDDDIIHLRSDVDALTKRFEKYVKS